MSSFDHPRWGFIINPIDNLFQSFAERSRSPDVDIWRIEPGHVSTEHVWASAHFDDVPNVQALADRAMSLKAVFDGAMFLEFGARYDPPTLLRVIDLRSHHRHDFPLGNVLAAPFSPATVSMAVPEIYDPMAHFGPEQMVFLARYDEVARAMLKHLGFNGPDYRTLYSLLDWLHLHGWKDDARIAAPSGLASSSVKQFTHSVNNVEMLGPHARHGGRNWKPADRTMPLDEAQTLILSAAYAFLQERAGLCDLGAKWASLAYREPHRL